MVVHEITVANIHIKIDCNMVDVKINGNESVPNHIEHSSSHQTMFYQNCSMALSHRKSMEISGSGSIKNRTHSAQ